MLAVLKIRNFAIVEELEIEFNSGLNVITGETGAGKSIILKAIELLGGKRASSEIIRSGSDRCEVSGLFYLDQRLRNSLSETLEELCDLEDLEEILVRRVIEANGRSKNYINGSLISLSVLQSIAPILIDITGQNSQHSLLDPVEHRRLLDEFGVPVALRLQVAEAYKKFAEATLALDRFNEINKKLSDRLDQLKFERQELDQAGLNHGEREKLDQAMSRLANVELLGQSVAGCLELIDDQDQGVSNKLQRINSSLSHALHLDPKLTEVKQIFDSVVAQFDEVRVSLADYLSSLEADPEQLEQLRERIAELARLERKYKMPGDQLIDYLTKISNEIDLYESGAFSEKKLFEAVSKSRKELDSVETQLTETRTKVALELNKLVVGELDQLNMKRAKFAVELSKTPSSQYGADRVEFMLAANPGEPFGGLNKVASGGELSRVLLVLKTLLNKTLAPAVQIFDEVDSGVGGAVSQIVGEKLKNISQHGQVILVTHAPQIAALADQHFVVSKSIVADRTITRVGKIAGEGRVEEIARMLAGKKVTANFVDSARELISN